MATAVVVVVVVVAADEVMMSSISWRPNWPSYSPASPISPERTDFAMMGWQCRCVYGGTSADQLVGCQPPWLIRPACVAAFVRHGQTARGEK